MSIDYTNPVIVVASQAELDAVPLDYHGRIIIKFGTPYNRAVVNRKFAFATVEASDSASVRASGSATVEATGSASVVAYDSATVVAYDSATVEAYDSATVRATDSATVWAWQNSSVDLNGFAQACIYSAKVVRANGHARLIYPTRSIADFMAYHAVEHTRAKSRWYKAVHKREDGTYTSDYDKSFIYEIGKTYTVDVDGDTRSGCGCGVNMATLSWALDYGKDWRDLAILEVEAASKDIVVPVESTGKVRTGKVKVLREVPLDECGLLGKHIARRRGG